MKTKTIVCIGSCALSCMCSWLAEAQGTFQNLDFEEAGVPASGAEPYGTFVPIGSALPGWTAYLGNNQQTQVGYNSPANSTASITLIGPTWNAGDTSSYGVGVIDGNYSVDLQTGVAPGDMNITENASISQNGTVPSSAQSLQFEAYETTPLTVSFDGNSLSPVALSTSYTADGLPYETYAADISAWAGQSGDLEFTADFNGHFNYVVLDDIAFSTNAVTPEPSTWALFIMGGTALGFNAWRKRGKVAKA